MTRNHARGGESVARPRNQGRRHSAAPDRSLSEVVDIDYPVICVQACCHWVKFTQSLLPLSHVASGVFQNLMVAK